MPRAPYYARGPYIIPSPRLSGYAVATGPYSALRYNRVRFLIRSGARAWANRARRNVARRRLAMRNYGRMGYPYPRRR